jgi:hypothetical protein
MIDRWQLVSDPSTYLRTRSHDGEAQPAGRSVVGGRLGGKAAKTVITPFVHVRGQVVPSRCDRHAPPNDAEALPVALLLTTTTTTAVGHQPRVLEVVVRTQRAGACSRKLAHYLPSRLLLLGVFLDLLIDPYVYARDVQVQDLLKGTRGCLGFGWVHLPDHVSCEGDVGCGCLCGRHCGEGEQSP